MPSSLIYRVFCLTLSYRTEEKNVNASQGIKTSGCFTIRIKRKESGNWRTERLFQNSGFHHRIHESIFIQLHISQGLKVKGLLAEPVDGEIHDAFLYLRGGIENVGKVRPCKDRAICCRRFHRFCPFYRGNQGRRGR